MRRQRLLASAGNVPSPRWGRASGPLCRLSCWMPGAWRSRT